MPRLPGTGRAGFRPGRPMADFGTGSIQKLLSTAANLAACRMHKALPLLLLIPLGLGPLAISGTAGAAAAAPVERRWWQELRSDSLAELKCAEADDLLNTLPAPWQVCKGAFKVRQTIDTKAPQSAALLDSMLGDDARKSPLESGRQGDSHLEAVEGLELCAGDSAWRDYTVCAEVMLGKDGEITLAAADALGGERGRRGHMVAVKGPPMIRR